MEKSSAEGPVLLFVQTCEWWFKLSRTTLAAASPSAKACCVLVGEQAPCLGPGVSCPLPPAPSSYALEKNQLVTFSWLAYLYHARQVLGISRMETPQTSSGTGRGEWGVLAPWRWGGGRGSSFTVPALDGSENFPALSESDNKGNSGVFPLARAVISESGVNVVATRI